MARVTKKIKPHSVIVDSNILFCIDKASAVNPSFDAFWSQYSKDCNLRLFIPQIVLGELQFQHFRRTTDSFNHINNEIKQIAKVACKKYIHNITRPKLKQQINNKFSRWILSKRAEVLRVPTEGVDWNRLVDMAIWRIPPFSYEEKEKGFRDSLIMETVVSFYKTGSAGTNVAFICGDTLLSTAVQARLKGKPNFSIYAALTDFENYLKLQKQEFKKGFIVEVLKNASAKFFQPNNPKTIYYKENIREKLEPDVDRYSNNPEMAYTTKSSPWLPTLLTIPEAQEVQAWEKVGSGTYWVSSPDIDSVKGKDYSWSTTITFVMQYRKKSKILLSDEEKLLVLTFKVRWDARIGDDARFWSFKFVNVKLVKTSFEQPTEDQIKKWDIKSLLSE
jgi:hypothetical protein